MAGSVQLQTVGVLVVIDRDLQVRHVSGGCETLLGRDAEALVGQSLAEVLDPADVARLAATITPAAGAPHRRHVTIARGRLKIRTFDPGAGLVGLDLLPAPERQGGSTAAAIERLSGWNERLLEAESVEELIATATEVTSELTGFDGSWIVRIEAADGTGRVISAEVPGGTPTALGTLVQASDLPPEALRLRGRYIPYFITDLAAATTELIPRADDLELAGSSLRQPFPEWLRWLASVGPRATVGVPIAVHGRLWGWILAHHPSAVQLSAAVQAELTLLGATTGTRLAELLAAHEARERLELSRASVGVLKAVAAADDLVDSLAGTESAFPGVCEATSAIVTIGGRREVVGAPLSREVVDQALSAAREELARPGGDPVVAHTTFGAQPAVDPSQAAGYAAMRLDAAAEHVVVWVRGEERRAVRWVQHAVVGDEPQDELFTGLAERVEEERGSCAPWTRAQLSEIAAIRESLAEVFVGRFGEMQSLTAELARSNEEYDAFAHAAAHDLKAPLRGIRQNVEFFLEDAQEGDPADPEMLQSAVGLADRMSRMLDDLMAYAHVGRAAWAPEPVDVPTAVGDAVELLGSRLEGATVVAEPGVFITDPAGLRQLLLNLIGNAAKYGGTPAHVTVRSTTLAEAEAVGPLPAALLGLSPETEVLAVADRGPGIDPAHHERIFGLFHQLDRTSAGSGAGLALCRLICRRNGGEIWLASEPGHGTTFFVVARA